MSVLEVVRWDLDGGETCMAIPWRRVPELRMCESKMIRRNVPDPKKETQLLRKFMWEIMKVKTVLSTLQTGLFLEKRTGPMDR